MATSTPAAKPKLDIQATMASIRKNYAEGTTRSKLNALVVGDFGTGKTTLARTCPQPIHMFSFDPGGPRVAFLKPLISAGQLLVEEFNVADSKNNTQYLKFATRFDQLRVGGYFDHIGTLFVDSLTTLAETAMNYILDKSGRFGTIPQIQDYLVLQNLLSNMCREFTSLPCNVIVTGHLDYKQDEASGQMYVGIMVSGKSSVKLPLLFDEVYVAKTQPGARRADGMASTEYKLQTGTEGKFRARTRIGAGVFHLIEEPDITALMQKAGLEFKIGN